jgi:hypothetical protein
MAIPASSTTIRIVRLAVLVAAGLAAYAAALQLLGVAQLRLLLAAVRERG